MYREQEQGVENECGEEAPAKILHFTKRGGVEERMHAYSHISGRGIAGDSGGHYQPNQAAKYGGFGNGKRGVEKEISIKHLGKGAIPCH
ncbi:MAG: hypothetical protein ACO1OF_08170 [Adhaeribacter sp.]